MGDGGAGQQRATAKLVALVSYERPFRPGRRWAKHERRAQAAFVRWYCTAGRPAGRAVHIAENYVTVFKYAVIPLQSIEGPAVMVPDVQAAAGNPGALPCFFELDKATRGF